VSSFRKPPESRPYIIIIIIIYYATQAAHRKQAQNIETIKHEKTKSTRTKILRLR